MKKIFSVKYILLVILISILIIAFSIYLAKKEQQEQFEEDKVMTYYGSVCYWDCLKDYTDVEALEYGFADRRNCINECEICMKKCEKRYGITHEQYVAWTEKVIREAEEMENK